MIRMGRSNTAKPEPPQQPKPETQSFEPNKTNQPFGFQPNENQQFRTGSGEGYASSNRAFTESENMARDIKEGRLSGFVGSGTTLTGETDFKAMLRVDGHLVGTVSSSEGTLVIGSTGVVDANINVAAAIINGTVNGDIIATEKIELGRTAKVIGNINTPSLMMETGAILEGNCSMMKPKADFDKRTIQNVVQTVQTEPVADKPEFETAIANDNSLAAKKS